MGATKPRPQNRIYFGCGGAGCLGLVFWAILASCMLLVVVGLSTELANGDAELVAAYYSLTQILVGSLAFCFSMGAIVVVFGGFGIYRSFRSFQIHENAFDLNTVILFFALFVGGMIMSAALPALALEYPGASGWVKTVGVLLGGVYLLFGMLMLWLTLVAYESYRYIELGELE